MERLELVFCYQGSGTSMSNPVKSRMTITGHIGTW